MSNSFVSTGNTEKVTQSQAMAKAYNPSAIEAKWYTKWLQSGCFKEKKTNRPSYSIVMPPPNVTGVLTMGHVLNNTLQDILARRARQTGHDVLWIPGTDHAGIATQTKVEQLLESEGSSRTQIGRAAFLKKACQWREKHGNLITEQLKKLGISCDWARSVYTLDEGYSKAVLSVFVNLYHKGYIYKGKRMVNWCPASLTALSDEEVISKPNKTKLYHIKYPLAEVPGEFLVVATTRPETVMADVAVAVHPQDVRFQKWIGKHVYRPLSRTLIPVIGDIRVEKDFGTGVLKITPAHDTLDFEIGKAHTLPFIDIINPDGTLNSLAGEEFCGLDRLKARPVVVDKLKAEGLLIEEKPYENMINYSERANVPIENRVSQQWFLKYPKVEEAKSVVSSGLIRFWPEHFEKTYFHWLEKIQDWCISRQLWWGHQIPVWYKKNSDKSDPANWHVSVDGPLDIENYEQEEDVLDTWFSSWLWPFATQGWPDKKAMEELNLNSYYPTGDLVTGPDILFFWVARMIIAGIEFNPNQKESIADKIPFKNVYFTGIIRDEKGRKMSKSLGNSPDPITLIEKYGADGLRFGIISMAPQGQDIHFSEERLALGRNFCNKLWNACRFRILSGPIEDNSRLENILKRINPSYLKPEDHAILHAVLKATENIEKAYSLYEFQNITQILYRLFWTDFCDWYLEFAKARPAEHQRHILAIQDFVLSQVIKLIYPFMPFISEELGSILGYINQDQYIHQEPIRKAKDLEILLGFYNILINQNSISESTDLQSTIIALRNLKAENNLATKRDITLRVEANPIQQKIISDNCISILRVVGAKSIDFNLSLSKDLSVVTALGTFYLEADISVELDKDNLLSQIKELEQLIIINQQKLNNPTFTAKAPPHVITGARKLLEENLDKKAKLEKLLLHSN